MRNRIESVDLLRGIAMVLMALDHTRDFFGAADNPTDVAKASSALFLTRWVTHLCAPTFFLLTGVGAGLARATRTRSELTRFLVTRGAILIVLELTLFRSLYQFNVDYSVTMLLVIWALGWSMIFLGTVIALPMWAVGTIGGALILGHNALDGLRIAHPLWAVLHGPGFVVRSESVTVFASYPLIPWIGVTAVGYALSGLYDLQVKTRLAYLLNLGLACVIGFLVLRYLNIYGDPSPWKYQTNDTRTVLSFLNTTKYPPSLLYLLMTLGPAFFILRWLDDGGPQWLRPIITFGKAPLFYFGAHFLLIHAAAVVVAGITHGSAGALGMFQSPDLGNYPFTRAPDWGFPLPVVWVVWIAVVAAMYPACKWMVALKERRAHPWLTYL